MNFNTPLSKVNGLGSAKEGVHHWWMQRLTGIALVPLMLWLVCGFLRISGQGYMAARNWIQSPAVATLMTLMVIALFWHARLGLQVIIEDYIHHKFIKTAALILMNFTMIGFGVGSIIAILRIALGGA